MMPAVSGEAEEESRDRNDERQPADEAGRDRARCSEGDRDETRGGEREKSRRGARHNETYREGHGSGQCGDAGPPIRRHRDDRRREGQREDEPRGDELRVSERGERRHLAERLKPEVEATGQRRLRQAERGDGKRCPEDGGGERVRKCRRPEAQVPKQKEQHAEREEAEVRADA
ncbi:MAG: hypothetical protein DMD64_03145 [Gemmatimonadetes bacterium]|nr:MAG: hypothetical protein DMD64_03145 [Gemmatimonadota bacterium]